MADAVRGALLLRECLTVLRESSDPLSAREALDRTAARVEFTPFEVEIPEGADHPRWETHLRRRTGYAAALGWVSRRGGWWTLTEAGETALDRYDADQLITELLRRRREIREHRATAAKDIAGTEHPVGKALSLVDEGTWTTLRDLSDYLAMPAEEIRRFLIKGHHPLPAAYRVLNVNGTLPAVSMQHPAHQKLDLRWKLESEGIDFDETGRAPATQRLTAQDLVERQADLDAAESAPAVRAWLVRGSSVDGRDLVFKWLEEGFVSLAGSTLPSLDLPIARDKLRAIVEDAYQHKSYSVRLTKADEIDAFCNRMNLGDYVLTTTGGKTFVGKVIGDADYVDSPDHRSNLRRDVMWFNQGAPVPYGNLPAPLPAKLSSQDDVVELTENLPAIQSLLTALNVEIEEPVPQPERELAFPRITGKLAKDLMTDRDWLQEQADLLWDKRQIIFYGPPGTGKTYLARKLAQHIAGPGAVKLVQFHPSYTYEDFFEGFRPKQEGGQLVFELRGGPFRRLVDAAREHSADPYILIIDEINRANLAKVFGELYFLLEYRHDPIGLLYSAENDFTLPDNLFIIGTMNTTDRSIALVDAAMRRRFAFVELHPSVEPTSGLLRAWLAAHGFDSRPADLLDELNRRIEERDLAIGPSFLMDEPVHQREDGLERVWKTSILPLLAEHHYGAPPEVLDRYRLDALRKALDDKPADPSP